MLTRDSCGIRLGSPAVLAPKPQVTGLRRAQEHPPKRRWSWTKRCGARARVTATNRKRPWPTSYHSGGTVFSSAVASVERHVDDRSPWSARHLPEPAPRRRGRLPSARTAWRARGRGRSGSRRAGRGRARSPASRSRCAPRSRARAASPTPPQADVAELVELRLLRRPRALAGVVRELVALARRRRSRSPCRARGGC